MSGLEVNKILASIFVAVIVVSLISILGDAIINKKNNQQVENAYYIDISEMETNDVVTNTQNEEISEQISMFLTSASFEKGEKLFKKCSACHNYQKDSANKVGPNLWNIINRPKASVQGFTYSKALAEFSGNSVFDFVAEPIIIAVLLFFVSSAISFIFSIQASIKCFDWNKSKA